MNAIIAPFYAGKTFSKACAATTIFMAALATAPALCGSELFVIKPSVAPALQKATLRPAANRGLQAFGLKIDITQAFETIAGDGGLSGGPFIGSLSDVDIRWRPNGPGLLRRSVVAAKYSLHAQTRDVTGTTLQALSNHAAETFQRWREAYVELPLWRTLRFKVGKVDANTEFAVLENGADFSNASLGVSPTFALMPSYPDGATSVNAFFTPREWVSFGAGAYRLPEGGSYSVAEAGGRWGRGRPGRLAIGRWHQSARNGLGGLEATSGSYVQCEQTMIPVGAGRGLRAFARVSTAEQVSAAASTHSAYGVTWTGFGRREHDSSGFAILKLRPSTAEQLAHSERAFEVYYRAHISKNLGLKMDVQYVNKPGGVADARPVAVAAIRLFINWSTGVAE